MLKTGLYEQIINKQLREELNAIKDSLMQTEQIDSAEAPKILALYAAQLVEKGLNNILDKGGDVNSQIQFTNKLFETIIHETGDSIYNELFIDDSAQQLLALVSKQNSIYAVNNKAEIVRPETSICQSSLFTGAIHEPSMYSELKKEILSSDRMDMLVSFIKWSGLRLIIEELKSFTQRGGELRIITTSYMGATDVKAINELAKLLNTSIKISYDTKRTRLHAKAYVFYRNTGFTTAYVGSSNLSNAAISSGLEWNVKLTAKDQPETIKKINATFDTYWNASEFEDYTSEQNDRLANALNVEKGADRDNKQYMFVITPYSYQQEILDKLDAERKVHNRYKNLVVAATGTGKTVISAFDYKKFCEANIGKPCRLLFIAHREEILKQSQLCYCGVLKNANFGDLYVGNNKPSNIEHLFMSIQTFNSQEWHRKCTPEFYDYIVVDEFHHAAAPTYQALMSYFKPKILLGLTATPERMDGKSITEYFDGRTAAEIRLPEAIDRKLLCPFQYFGVTDTIDLKDLKWARGGYDRTELSNVYTIDSHIASRRSMMIIDSIYKYVTDINDVKGLGFCVSVQHAEYMADYFNQNGITSIALTGNTPDKERSAAKEMLEKGDVKFIFVVDIYNEGVDIPDVNTILFLRPTESLTIFLQQLGRGLRLSPNKECLVVLDFIGQASKKYNFEDKFKALLSDPSKDLQREIKNGFVAAPKGCFIQLERKAKEYILDNIKSSFGAKQGIITRIKNFQEDSGKELSIANFVDYYHLDIRNIYNKDNFSRLSVQAEKKDDFEEELEEVLTKAFPRICAIDSRRWITFLIDVFENLDKIQLDQLSVLETRMLQMFQFTVWQKTIEDCGFSNLKDGLIKIRECKTLYSELIELLKYNYNRIDFIDEQIQVENSCPLDVHCTYNRDQILVALDFMKPSTVREGVKYLSEKNLDIFFVTLNKSDKDYSPSTMYNDYSINEWMFHWQSQSTTSAESKTGLRYINHQRLNNKILLFVREYKKDIGGTSPYTFLGIANYINHEGSCPMNITWKLERPIPAKFMKKSNKLMVG